MVGVSTGVVWMDKDGPESSGLAPSTRMIPCSLDPVCLESFDAAEMSHLGFMFGTFCVALCIDLFSVFMGLHTHRCPFDPIYHKLELPCQPDNNRPCFYHQCFVVDVQHVGG